MIPLWWTVLVGLPIMGMVINGLTMENDEVYRKRIRAKSSSTGADAT